MGIAAVQRNNISSDEFKEVHYTVTTPGTPPNMGGFGVHITLVRHADKKAKRDRVHVYFSIVNGALQTIQGLGQTHPITGGGLFGSWKQDALAFFRQTCNGNGWPMPGGGAPVVAVPQSYDSAYPALRPSPPRQPQAVIPSPPQTHIQTVGLPVNTNVAPLVVALPIAQANMHFDVVQSVLDASGAFDDDDDFDADYDVVGSVLAHCGAFD
jgi:hypothetical protein